MIKGAGTTLYLLCVLIILLTFIECNPVQTTSIYIYFDEFTTGRQFISNETIEYSSVSSEFHPGDWSANGFAKIDNRGYAKGYCKDLQLSNINITVIPHINTNKISLRFGELGGKVAFGVNGSPTQSRDLIDFSGLQIGGTDITIDAVQQGNNWYGILLIEGEIDSFTIGGQELWMDDICLSLENTQARSKILYDARIDETRSSTDFWNNYKAELVVRDYTNEYHTSGNITLSQLNNYDVYVIRPYLYQYVASEKQAVNDFINGGGSVLIAAEYGPTPSPNAVESIFDIFGVVYENNKIEDPTNHYPGNSPSTDIFWVIYNANDHFKCHPVLRDVTKIRLDAASTLAGPGWTILVETDNDAIPSNRPMVISNTIGDGRVLFIGDCSIFNNDGLNIQDNKRFVLQIMDWLLYRI